MKRKPIKVYPRNAKQGIKYGLIDIYELGDLEKYVENLEAKLKQLQKTIRNSDYVKCSACGMPLNSSCDCVNKDCMVCKLFT